MRADAAGQKAGPTHERTPDRFAASGLTVTFRHRTHFLSFPVLTIAAALVTLAIYLLRLLLYARTWPIVHDAAILHYVTFMIDSGRAPYTSMVEMNLPGALMSEWFGVHVFGANAAGLWRWDTFMGVLAVIGSAWLAGRHYRLEGIAGALFTCALHLNDAAFDFGERDWLIAALSVLALACTAEALERRESRWMLGALALSGWCCAIKPFCLVLPLALLFTVLWRMRKRWHTVLLWSVLGALLPALATVLYFAHWPGSFAAFVHTERTLGAWYGTLGRATWHYMLFQVLLYPVIAALLLVAFLFFRMRGQLQVRETLLAVGTACGLLIYLVQRKGFAYHVYPFMLPAAVLGFVLARRALASAWSLRGLRGWDARVAAIVFLTLCAVRLPAKFWGNRADAAYPGGTQQALIADLQSLGGHALSGSIQCLDMTLGGCIGAEYDLRLVQTTGFVNDHLLFPYPASASPVLAEWQDRFLAEMSAKPPRLIVLTAHNWPNQDDRNFTKPDRWPQFATWLAANYRLERTHLAATQKHTASYRIYLRK